MSRKMSVELIDDLDGRAADETVHFSIDGKDYEIDLSANHALALRENLADYIEAGRKTSATSRKSPAPNNRERARAVRTWGQANGFTIAERGRVPGEVWTAYEKAN